jgi:uncharacterized membrane protein
MDFYPIKSGNQLTIKQFYDMTISNAPVGTMEIKSTRIETIDLLRGMVMIIMALDHVRDYFHADAFLFNPVNLEKTYSALFFTRWITHFCAPVFVFLAGTSAFFVGARKGKKELSSFLLKRGLWLITLEFTVINFAWFFNIQFSFIALTVIWALGLGMVVLAAVVHLPFKVILITGLLLVFAHNLLDSFHFGNNDTTTVMWSLIHEAYAFQSGHLLVFIGYPIVPWAGVMMLGYCLGYMYMPSVNAIERKTFLVRMGLGMILLFIILRFTNIYGEPITWTVQKSSAFTFMSFMNVSKYPPSLLYLLATLGPAFILLAWWESINIKNNIIQYIVALGRVPMFYYIAHLFLIHLIAVAAALATGYEFSDMVFNTWVTDSANLKSYGFGLGVVYLVWVFVVLTLLPLCLWYDQYKIQHREKWWLSYL